MPASPHKGIELDVLDLSGMTGSGIAGKMEEKPQRTARMPEDPKHFVQSLYTRVMKSGSMISFTRQIDEVNAILKMKYSSADDVARVIMKDVNLASKVLKLVNSSFYGQFASQGVSTISEAMIILGTEQIKLAAATLKIYELMANIANIKVLKDKTIQGLQRSIIVRQIAMKKGYQDVEALQMSAMLYDLGEYLVALHYPDQYIQVEMAMEDHGLSKQTASRQVLGVSYSDLGKLICMKWHLPKTIVSAMQPITHQKTSPSKLPMSELKQYVCAFANDICEKSQAYTGQSLNQEIRDISLQYKQVLNIGVSDTITLLKHSWEKIQQHAAVFNIQLKKNADEKNTDTKRRSAIARQVDLIKQQIKRNKPIHEVLLAIVKAIEDGFDFSSGCICIKNKSAGQMKARFAFGKDHHKLIAGFKFSMAASDDFFNHSLSTNARKVIPNFAKDKNNHKIPPWFFEQYHPHGFAILPIRVKQQAVALIYVAWDKVPPMGEIKMLDDLETFKHLVVQSLITKVKDP